MAIKSSVSIDDKLSRAFELFENNQLIEAEEIYEECLTSIDKKSGNYTVALHWLGYVKSQQRKFDEARTIYMKLKEVAKSNLNLQDEHIAIHQLGMVERMAENYDKALELFGEEIKILRTSNPSFYVGFAANYYERGYILMKQNNLVEAERRMKQSLRYSELAADPICLGCALRGLGEIKQAKGEFEKAKNYFEQSILSFKEEGNSVVAVNEVIQMLDEI